MSYKLTYTILIGRAPSGKNMTHCKHIEFESIDKADKWVDSNFTPNCIWWVDYTITDLSENKIIRKVYR